MICIPFGRSAIAIAAGLCAACTGSATLLPPGPQVAGIELVPATMTINVGTALHMAAAPFDGRGKPISGHVALFWSASNSVVSVDSLGVVTGLAPGVATVTVKAANSVTASSTVTVSKDWPPPPGVAGLQAQGMGGERRCDLDDQILELRRLDGRKNRVLRQADCRARGVVRRTYGARSKSDFSLYRNVRGH